MLSCSIRFSAPSSWMGGGLESRCVGRVCGADGAVKLALTFVSRPALPFSSIRIFSPIFYSHSFIYRQRHMCSAIDGVIKIALKER